MGFGYQSRSLSNIRAGYFSSLWSLVRCPKSTFDFCAAYHPSQVRVAVDPYLNPIVVESGSEADEDVASTCLASTLADRSPVKSDSCLRHGGLIIMNKSGFGASLFRGIPKF